MGFFRSSKNKQELKEAKAQLRQLEKRKREKMATSSSVDPSKAITELQPWQVNQERSVMSLSQIQHKDIWGNPIKEPDLTNPTRSRWERPLDTIKSFQESIDRGYRRSYHGGEPDGGQDSQWQSPRNSQRYDGGDQYNYPHYNRTGATNTPLSNPGEDHPFGVGAMSSRNALNEGFVMGSNLNRARNYSNDSAGYPDTGYGSIDHSSRANSSGNLENDFTPPSQMHSGTSPNQSSPLQNHMTAASYASPPPPPQVYTGTSPNQSSPLQNHMAAAGQASPPPPPQQIAQRNVIRLNNPPPQSPPQEKRRSWIGKRLSRG